MLDKVNPPQLGTPSGYSHGVVVPAGSRLLLVAGQIGFDPDAVNPGDFVHQFAGALDRILAVVRAAGGNAGAVARLTIYVTDLIAYRASRKALAEVWSERFGKHYPAMALVEVKGLVEPGAQVEIEATAVLAGGR